MPVQIGAKPLADFSRPIEMMSDCHRRIEHFLDVLIRGTETAKGGPLEEGAREALRTALDYFHRAAPRHTEDEERSLFPRLRACSDRRVQEALAKVEALEADHAVAGELHDRVEAIGRQWLSNGWLPPQRVEELRELLLELRTRYQPHIHLEDTEIFEIAKEVLSPATIQAIGEEMAARRRERPGRASSRCGKRRRGEEGGS